MRDLLEQLLAGRPLDEAQAEDAFHTILTGGAEEPQIAALLALIQRAGVTADVLVGAARVMRRHVLAVPASARGAGLGPIIDTAGTGGTRKTFNVSTAAAVVAAAAAGPARVRVAKHGNRSRTGRGSAEVLEALGVNTAASPETQARCLDELGVCFCFAIHHHPAAKHAAGVRKSLGFPTVFNLLGPLTNPAGARRQVMGVFRDDYVELVAHALVRLGAERALTLHSQDGLDELTTTAPTCVAEVLDGEVTMATIDAASVGLPAARIEDLEARDLPAAAALFRDTLGGQTGPALDMVLLNAAAALLVAGVVEDLREGVEMAREAVADGRAAERLRGLASLSHSS